MTPEARATKENKVDLMKSKDLCVSKETIKRAKRNAQNGRQSLQIVYLIRNLYTSIIHQELLQVPNKGQPN